MTYKHIIWDWNGTLWDDAELCTEVNNHMLARRDLPQITLETYQDKLCFPVSDYYDQLGFDYEQDSYETLAKEYIAEYTVRRFECPLRNGARELLDYFRDRQIPQAVLSAYEQTALQEAVDHYELAGYFDEVIGLNDIYAEGKVANGLAYIKQLNVDPAAVLFIGDTIHDFEVAQAMGVHCVLVSGGHNSRSRLETCGVPIFSSLRDVRTHIDEKSHWTVCSVCHGGGKKRLKPSKKVRRRYKRALYAAEKGSAADQPPPPVAHIEDCADCGGAGLKKTPAATPLNTSYPSIAIIGGGLGGLALAVACRHRGIPCAIYERDAHFDQRSQGYGLTMQQASKALACFGLSELREGITSTKHVVHKSDGTVIGEWGMRKWGRSPTKAIPKRRNVHVPRQSLRNELLQALGGAGQVQWSHRFMDYEEGEGHMDLRFQVGPDAEVKTIQADIIVGADGIRSSVREQWIGDEASPLRYLDCMVILGICPLENIDESVLLDGETVFQTANGHERMYMMPYSPTTIMWQLSFPLPEEEAIVLHHLGAHALKEEALRRCPAWHAPIPQIIAETPESLITGYPAYDRDILTSELLPAESRVTLLGDAAHPMSPFKGQGANQALLDALSLARILYKTPAKGSERQTLRAFEAEMLPRSAVKVKASAEAAKFLHTDVVLYEGNLSRGAAAEIGV